MNSNQSTEYQFQLDASHFEYITLEYVVLFSISYEI